MLFAQLLASGQCGCLDYDLTQGDDYIEVYNRLDLIDDLIGDAPDDIKRQVVAIICSTTVNDGDHLQVRLRFYTRPLVLHSKLMVFSFLGYHMHTARFTACSETKDHTRT